MRHSATPLYILMLIVGDFLALLSGFVIAYVVRVNVDTRPLIAEVAPDEYLRIFLTLIPFLLMVFASLNLYRQETFEAKLPETGRLFVASFLSILLIIGYEFASESTVFPARLVAVYGFLGSFALLFVERTLLRWLRRGLYHYGVGVQNLMIVGSTEATKKLAKTFADSASTGYRVKAIVGRKEVLPKGFVGKHFSKLEDAIRQIKRLGVNTVVQTEIFQDEGKNKQVLRFAQTNHLAYRFIPTQDEFFTGNHTVELFHGFPVIAVHQTRLLGWQRILKRGLDVTVGLMALPFIMVLYPVIGLAIKLEDWRGPVIYKSKRVTRFNTKFNAYKFRTMYWRYCTKDGGKSDEQILRELDRDDLADQVASGDVQLKDDPRITKVGKFLRSTALDEIPQFLNILRGYMSLVGPRAITPRDMKLYKDQGSILLYVKTGLTGLAQVSGRSDISYEERAKLNLYYVQNWSFWLDIRIIARTITVILSGKGIR